MNSREVNAAAWVIWFAAVALWPVVSRNPLYLLLDLLIVLVVYVSLPRRTSAARAWRLFVVVGSSLASLSIAFNVLTVHIGDRVFGHLPDRLPIIGGNLTWNAFTYGVLSALAIATLLLAAATLNTAVRHSDLFRLVPDAFAQLGIAGTIGLGLVPHTISAAREIFDAQRARGQSFRKPAAAAALLVPLLNGGLERAVTLSEALEARGFGAAAGPPAGRSRLPRIVVPALLLAAILAISLGWIIVGIGLLLAGAGLLLRSTSASRRTRFRDLGWNLPSRLIALVGGVSALGLLAIVMLDGNRLAYDPFPILRMPQLELLPAVLLLPLLAPLFRPVP